MNKRCQGLALLLQKGATVCYQVLHKLSQLQICPCNQVIPSNNRIQWCTGIFHQLLGCCCGFPQECRGLSWLTWDHLDRHSAQDNMSPRPHRRNKYSTTIIGKIIRDFRDQVCCWEFQAILLVSWCWGLSPRAPLTIRYSPTKLHPQPWSCFTNKQKPTNL